MQTKFKDKGVLITVTVALIFAAVAVVLWQTGTFKKWFLPKTASEDPTDAEKQTIAAAKTNDAKGFPLKLGSSESKGVSKLVIKILQQNLNTFWQKNGKFSVQGVPLPLKTDGVLGPKTWGLWVVIANKISSDTEHIDESDWNALAKAVGNKIRVINGKFYNVK
jgi:hypothetical protein